jgi:hypothetical protein
MKEIILSTLVPFEMIGAEDVINHILQYEKIEQMKKLLAE